ncbi:MAG TPA: serine protease [Acidobacteriota bacterium]|nr:serine protease [Acidobacteriota bacterium]
MPQRFRIFVVAVSILLPAILWSQDAADLSLPKLPEVQIRAYDSHGALIHDSLGFIWDDRTIVTSYSAMQGASLIKMQINGENVVAGEMVSWSKPFDLAFLRTQEELPEGRLLGSSDTLASGDPAFLFSQDHGQWKLKETKLKKWEDSGQGYVWLYLSDATNSASPLFNSAGKIVGWFPGKPPAIPLKAVFAQLGDKSTHVSLQEFTLAEKFWNTLRVPSREQEKKGFEQTAFKKITGPQGYPFQIHIPEAWEFQTSNRLGHFLLLAVSGQNGVSLALRIAPALTGDLNMEMERAENLLFPGIPRQDMIPTQIGGIAGLRAQYEDAQGYSSTAFYGLNTNRLFVLSITYPVGSAEEITPVLEEIVNSLRFSAN